MSEDKNESDTRDSTVTFAVDELPDTSKNPPVSKKNSSKRSSLRSSFFNLKSLTFRKYVPGFLDLDLEESRKVPYDLVQFEDAGLTL